MRLTSFTDYGLRVLMRRAGAPDRMFTTDQIATEFAISRNHLTKVVQDLVRHGYVIAQRGKGGGQRQATAREAFLEVLNVSTLADCAYFGVTL